MTTPEPQPTSVRSGVKWSRRSIRILIAVITLASLGLGFSLAYFREVRLDGSVLYAACACGHMRAEISNGEVVLLEPKHGIPAGTIDATIEIKDGICTLRRIRDGTFQAAESYEVDHLGAGRHDERFASYYYVIMTDNWKLYPFALFSRIERLFR